MLNAQPHGQGGKYQIALPLLLSAVIFVLFSASFFNRLLGLGFATAPWLETFASYFIAITLEAVPFILIGALFTAVLETWLPAETLPAITARLGFWGVPATALLAPLFPVCECGVVMVVRGLLRKGLPLPHAVTYLLAAPILNPTVLASTYIAFQDASYPIWRGLGGFAVAVGIGLAFMAMNERRAFRPAFFREINSPQAPPQAVQPLDGLIAPAGHEHSEACGHSHHNHGGGSLRHVAGHIADDFLEMMPYFLFGVLIASTLKTFLSSSLLLPLGEGAVTGPLAMMSLAFVLSLCSEADAFVAATFFEFNFASVMSFLVLGPMFDIKLLMMYRPIFSLRFVVMLGIAIWLGVGAFTAFLEAVL